MKHNIKQKIISIILLVCMLFSNFTAVFASEIGVNPIDGGIIPPVLQSANEINMIENSDTTSIAEAVFDDYKVTVEWDRMSNHVIMTEEFYDNKTRTVSETIENSFDVEVAIGDDGFYFTGDVEYNNSTYNAEELTAAIYSEELTHTILGELVGWSILNGLINAGVTITVSEMVYALYQEIVGVLEKNKKKYKSYRAVLGNVKGGGQDLFIGDPFLSTMEAGRWMSIGSEFGVWSVNQLVAFDVAEEAGRGFAPTKYENHYEMGKKGKFYDHYHAYARKGGHSWFGEGIGN